MSNDYEMLKVGCPLFKELELAKTSGTATERYYENRTPENFKRADAEGKKARRIFQMLEHFALAVQPDLNKVYKQGEAARFVKRIYPNVVVTDEHVRESAAFTAVRNLRDACITPPE